MTPCAWTAASVWQLLQVSMKRVLPSCVLLLASSVRKGPTAPTDSPREAITAAGMATPKPT